MTNLPWTQTEKDNWTMCLALKKKPVLYLNAVTDEEGRPLENEEESGRRLCEYYSPGNQFERFRGFLELIRRFEFDFRRRENYFFERFEFLVRSCECAVPRLCPRNSISNVVVFVTIHDDMFLYVHIYKRCLPK